MDELQNEETATVSALGLRVRRNWRHGGCNEQDCWTWRQSNQRLSVARK